MKTWLWIPIVLSCFAGTARADQCGWIDEGAADNARTILTSAPMFIEHCEPCSDKAHHAARSQIISDAVITSGKSRSTADQSTSRTCSIKTDAAHYRNARCPRRLSRHRRVAEPRDRRRDATRCPDHGE